MIGGFRLPAMPITGHVMILVIGVLIVAQGATLILTLAFPPQPPPQHSLEDIARAMRGQKVEAEGSRPLIRKVLDSAPRPQGPGWLSAEGPRDRLATMLNADPSDVVLMFYVPLPAGAQPMTRPTPPQTSEQQTPQDRRVSEPPPPAPPPELEPPGEAEPVVVAASFVGQETPNPLLIRARYSPADQPAFLGDRSFPGPPAGGLSSNVFSPSHNSAWSRQAPRLSAERPVSVAQQGRPWANGGRDFVRTPNRSTSPSFSPPTTGAHSTGRSLGAAWSRPAGQSSGDDASPRLGGAGFGRALAAALVERRRKAATSSGVMIGTSVSTTISLASAAPIPKSSVVASPPSVAADLRTPPAATPPAPVTPVDVSSANLAVDAPTTTAVQTASEPRPEPADVVLTPTETPPPVRRGLFAPAPAGYIEGDFIAAQRVGDRWIVVEPRPEGFPSAWQSRVMLWFLLSFALVAPFGWLFARRITAPLRSFADAAERLGRDPSAPATVQGGSAEIGRAAAAFNLMQGRLKRYVDDRTAMIGAISHDLRTPLTRMRFRLEAAPDKLKPGFETDIDQMEAMISSVLTFMRDQAEGGARQRLDLRALLKAAVDDAVAGGANVAIEPGEAVEVEADAVALNRVFANLLDNAVKYGGRAVVRLGQDGGDVVAAVRDFGPGLPDSELERVFKPFYRAPHAVSSDAPGMGLGLANSRSIVLAHGGTIRLKSQDGLTAEVRLPLAV